MQDPHPLDALLDALADRLAERVVARMNGSTADEMLTTDEAAALLKTDRKWIYRHAEELGAVRLTRRKLLVPRAGVQKFLKHKR